MTNWHEQCISMYRKGIPPKEISVALNQKYEAVHSCIKRWKKNGKIGFGQDKVEVSGSEDSKKVTYSSVDDSYTYEMMIKIPKGEQVTPEKVLKINNLDADKWEVKYFTFNNWQGFKGTENGNYEKVDLYQVKLQVQPRIKKEITFDDIENYFAEKKWENIKVPQTPKPKDEYDTLEICLTDLHIGLYAHKDEVGQNYDTNIACTQLTDNCKKIVQRCQGRHFKKIIIASLGDILHIDSNQNGGQTTKGTVQDADGRVQHMVEKTFDAFITCINMLLEIAPIDFVYVKGNHDEVVGNLFAFALKQAYRDCESINFDISPNPQKARLIGKCLVGWEHNSGAKARQGDWLVNDYRELFAKCKYAELHAGHLHSQNTNERATGVVCKDLPATCGVSAWEHQSNYRSYRATVCFVWSDTELLKEQWYVF